MRLGPRPGADLAHWLVGHEHLLTALLAYPTAATPGVQLHLQAAPGKRSPTLSMRCFLACSGATPQLAEEAARDLATLFIHGFADLWDAYSLQEPNAAHATPTLQWVDAGWDLVEIAPRVEILSHGEQTALPLPLPASAGTFVDLCRALLAQAAGGTACTWVVTLAPINDGGEVERFLHDQTATAGMDLHTAHSAIASGQGSVAVLDHAQRLWSSGTLAAAHALRARGPLARVQAFLGCQGHTVPDWLIGAALTAVGGAGADDGSTVPPVPLRPVRPRERHLALQALHLVQCRAWEEAHRRPTQMQPVASLRRLANVAAAGALFRLPLPAADGLPGMEAHLSLRERWLSRTPTATSGAALLGDNVAGDARQPIAVSREDRRRHLYVVGQTGVGKSHLLEQLAVRDMEAGDGVIVIDPHGDLVQHLLARIPRGRRDDVILLDPTAADHPVGYNLLDCPEEDLRYRVVEEFLGTLQKLYDPRNEGIVGPRFKHAVRNGMLTVMDGPGGTLVEVVRVLTDMDFVRERLPNVRDPMVRRYWTDQVANTSDFHRSEVLDYIVSKFSPFVSHPLVRNIVGQRRSAFRMRDVMDQGKILLVTLAQGRLGAELSRLLAAVLIPEILLAAFSRADVPETARRDCFLYVDEFQHYASPTFVEILSGARKYRLNLTVAHQHVSQLDIDTRAAIFGNVGTVVAFRVGLQDAPVLAAALQPRGFAPDDYLALPNYRAYARVPVDGQPSPCFSLATHHYTGSYDMAWADEVRAAALTRWGRPRALVEEAIARSARL
jgi:hypothetical protein